MQKSHSAPPPRRPKGQTPLITEPMRLWAAEFLRQMRIFEHRADLNHDTRTAMAAMQAEEIFPLEEWERAEVKDICHRNRLVDLVKGVI